MPICSRREVLTGPLALAGMAALAPRGLFALAAPGEVAAPSQRFLEAVRQGEVERVRELLAADPGLLHVRDEAGRSAFALALLAGHQDVGSLLRERGYGPDLAESALALDWERFEALAEESPGLVNRDHPVGGTPMYAAALAGAGSQMFRPYVYGGDPNANPRGEDGFTPLRAALEHPDLATAELTAAMLLGNGGEPNAPQARGSSPLHAAAGRGSFELAGMLLRKGAEVEARDDEGRTPLDLAEARGHRQVADLLRRHREIPRDHSTSRLAYDVEGRPFRPADLSAFSVLTRNRLVGDAHFDLETTRAGVERHPELAKSIASTTESAVEGCAHTGQLPIVEYLLGHGAPYSLLTAVVRNDLARARALLDEDPLRIHERGPHDFALLWYPVIGRGLLEMAELLLSRGAEVERQDFLGTTALHFAALGGQLEMAALLLEHGADPRRVGRKFEAAGQTSLQLAEGKGHDEVARLLRRPGRS